MRLEDLLNECQVIVTYPEEPTKEEQDEGRMQLSEKDRQN